MNLPNILTLFRLVLVPLYAVVFCKETQAHVASALIFWAASATDVLDGYLARKLHMTTKLGQVLDPLADKCMQLAVVITDCHRRDCKLFGKACACKSGRRRRSKRKSAVWL